MSTLSYLHIAANNPCRITGGNAIVWNIFCYHRTCPNNDIVSDSHSGKDNGVNPDEAIRTNERVTDYSSARIMCKNGHIRGQLRIRTDMYATRIDMCVQFRSTGQIDMVGQIHSIEDTVTPRSNLRNNLVQPQPKASEQLHVS